MSIHSSFPSLIYFAATLTACGGPIGDNKSAAKKSLDAGVGPVVIDAAGNDCKPNGVATTDPGKPARIALNIQGAAMDTHALAYVSNTDLQVNFNEVILPPGAGVGTYKATVVLMDRRECAERGGGAVCQQTGTRMPSDPGFGDRKTVSFVVTNTQTQVLDNSSIGRGQDGIVSDLINQEGLVGMFGGMLGGGGLGGVGNVAGAGKAARENSAGQQVFSAPVGGCTGQATVGTPDQASSAASGP